jgi:ribonuclease G
MHQAENRHKVYERMKDAMAVDRTKHNILPLSKFCLLQITRQRVRPEEHVETAEVCPTCKGTGKITPTILLVDELESKVKYIFKELNKNKVIIKTHPYLAAFLNQGFWSLKNKWAFKFFKSIKVEDMSSYSLAEYHFFDENQEEIVF